MLTGYVFDEIFIRHDLPGHPENANRLVTVLNYLEQYQFLPRLVHVPGRPATTEELTRCHRLDHLEWVKKAGRERIGHLDPDTYVNEFSYEAALWAAGGLIDLTAAVIEGRLNNGFALVRPPGHHATPTRAMGFCLFNNVAVAARAAQSDYGVERVAIVDFDVHHGNGTQDIFVEDPTVLFVSSHQYPFYPGSGAITEIGHGPAKGTVVNLPLPIGVGDEGFKQLYSQVVFPILGRFQPDLILISAGFDAHWDDPLASIGLSLIGYHWLCQSLIKIVSELCQGRIVFVLEGGYNLTALASGVGNVFSALLGDTAVDDPLGPSPWPEPKVSDLVDRLRKIHHLTV